MKINVESTPTVGMVNGLPARLWVGTTETGFPVHAYIALISPQTHDEAENARFAAELGETQSGPSGWFVDARFIL